MFMINIREIWNCEIYSFYLFLLLNIYIYIYIYTLYVFIIYIIHTINKHNTYIHNNNIYIFLFIFIKICLLFTFLLLYTTSSYAKQRQYSNLGQPYSIKISKQKRKYRLNLVIKSKVNTLNIKNRTRHHGRKPAPLIHCFQNLQG